MADTVYVIDTRTTVAESSDDPDWKRIDFSKIADDKINCLENRREDLEKALEHAEEIKKQHPKLQEAKINYRTDKAVVIARRNIILPYLMGRGARIEPKILRINMDRITSPIPFGYLRYISEDLQTLCVDLYGWDENQNEMHLGTVYCAKEIGPLWKYVLFYSDCWLK